MKKTYLIFFFLLTVALALTLSGCGKQEQSLDGKNIVTFELEGGTLDYGTASTNTNIFYAYEPGSYILDPAEIPNYKMYRSGYVFTGWYTSKDCSASSKWNFSTPFETETLTLYAGWKKAIVYSYTLYYTDGESAVSVGKYEVNEGDKFEDWRKYAANRAGYTPMSFYSDAALTTPWSNDTVHPGGETDLDIPVYVKYIEGVWNLVDNFTALKSALSNNKNIYLTADVDCAGQVLFDEVTYSGIFNGNGYTVSNFTVAQFGTTRNPTCAMFKLLGEGAVIKDVSFTGVVYDFTSASVTANSHKVAALAVTATGAKVSSVTISGTIKTNCNASIIPNVNSAFYENSESSTVTDFVANVTIENS